MPAPAPSVTLAVSIDRDPRTVLDYVLDPRNLPEWAKGFALAVQPPESGDEDWTVETAGGPVAVRFVAPNDLGVADHRVRLPDGTTIVNPMRVLPNGDGAEVLFTLFRSPDVADEDFHRDRDAVARDLERLAQALRPDQPAGRLTQPTD